MIQLRNNKFLSEEEKCILEDIKINFETDPDFEIVLDYIRLFGIKELVNLEEDSIKSQIESLKRFVPTTRKYFKSSASNEIQTRRSRCCR